MADEFIDLDDSTAVAPPVTAPVPTNTATSDEMQIAIPTNTAKPLDYSPKKEMEAMIDEYRRLLFCVDVSGSMGQSIPMSVSDPTRISKSVLAKKLLKRAISERFDKYRGADISVVTFDSTAELSSARTREELDRLVDTLYFHGGGTNITNGVKRCLSHCKKSPSAVHVHNVVLITDGLDYGAQEIANLKDELIAKGIILDVLLIRSAPEEIKIYKEEDLDEYGDPKEGATPSEIKFVDRYDEASVYGEAFKVLHEVCQATNGRFQKTFFGEELETLFLEAATRLALPPGGGE